MKATLNVERPAGLAAATGSAYRYEALCQVCWKQFELPEIWSDHVCQSPLCQSVKLMSRCDHCDARTHHETNGIGMWICAVCHRDNTPNEKLCEEGGK
jgi:hypothetical protein